VPAEPHGWKTTKPGATANFRLLAETKSHQAADFVKAKRQIGLALTFVLGSGNFCGMAELLGERILEA